MSRRTCIFWNVQRLFAPQPGRVGRALNAKHEGWSSRTYKRKVENVAACISRLSPGAAPLFIGLAEVETPQVVRDLRDAAGLVHHVSVDDQVPPTTIEALDVALLYDRRVFEERPELVASLALDNHFSTRDLLRVRLRLRDSLAAVEIMVAHWPSRLVSEGDSLRMAYSVYLRRLLTSILKYDKADIVDSDGSVHLPAPEDLLARWHTPCVIMGDLNDEPFDPSLRSGIGSTRQLSTVLKRGRLVGKSLTDPERYLSEDFSIFNPCWTVPFEPRTDDATDGGTYYRSPDWRIYDQALFSHGALIDTSPLRLVTDSLRAGRIADFNIDDRKVVSMTTSSGLPRAHERDAPEGVSDHLPLLWDMELGANS